MTSFIFANPGYTSLLIPPTVYDTDALAFLTATGISDNASIYYPTTAYQITGHNIWLAINQWYVDMKAAGLYNLVAVRYHFVGGTATSHSYNGINPAVNALTYVGSPAHGPRGMSTSGAYARTGLIPATSLNLNSTGISYFGQFDINATAVMLGASDASYINGLYILPQIIGGIDYSRANSSNSNAIAAAGTAGLNSIMRTSAMNVSRYHDTTTYYNSTADAATGLTTSDIWLGALNRGGTVDLVCSNILSDATIWNTGLNSTQHGNFNTIDHALQIRLNRNA